MKKTVYAIYHDSLFRNSFYLMLATAVMAGLGFFFWLISARLVSVQNIGLATTLISIMGIISTLSLIGFDSAIIRFLPQSRQRNDELNTALILVGTTAAVLAVGFLVLVHIISPQLSFIRESPQAFIAFVIFCTMAALSTLAEAVFLAFRATKYTLIVTSIFSLFKLIFPFLFASWGALGIFISAAAAQAISFILYITVMIWKFNFRPQFIIYKDVVWRVWRYCAGNYFAGIFSFMPVMILPILITNRLGAAQTAYYYIVMMLGNLLYVIPQATTSSLFAEGSYDEHALNKNVKKTIKIIASLLIPAIILVFVLGTKLLLIFGKSYSSEGTLLLYLVAITGLAISVNNIFGSFFRVKRDLLALALSSIFYASAVLCSTYVLLPLGLLGVGAAWFVGNLLAAFGNYSLYWWNKPKYLNLEPVPFLKRIDNIQYDLKNIVLLKLNYFWVFLRRGFKRKSILFYPDRPEFIHTLYKVCHKLGYRMTNDINENTEIIIAFADTTIRKKCAYLSDVCQHKKVINNNCGDISKERVEKIFNEVYGYGTFVDPETYVGDCVRKSSNNAKHDGKIITCPAKREDGFIYQKLINNIRDHEAVDIRVPVINNKIPFILLRHKSADDRFDYTTKAYIVNIDTELDQSEIQNILSFCKRFGLDYGELDMLRNKDDGKLYIVDVNNTPGTHRRGRQIDKKCFKLFMQKYCQVFASEFLNN